MTASLLASALAADSPWRATADFTLAPLEDADAADLLAHFADPQVVAFMDIEPLGDLDDALAIVRRAAAQRADSHGARLVIRERRASAFVGTCGFNSLTFNDGRYGEIAYDLGVAWWGRGVMRQILPHLIALGFEALDLRRLQAMVTPSNHRSCVLLERHGFTREGLQRECGFWKGRFQDQLLYALPRSRG